MGGRGTHAIKLRRRPAASAGLGSSGHSPGGPYAGPSTRVRSIEACNSPPQGSAARRAQKNRCMISAFAKNFAWRTALMLRICANRPSADSRIALFRCRAWPSAASFTACGLALPPVAFITWPTNQPSMVGFAFACSTLSGLAAMICVDGRSRSRRCRSPASCRALSTIARGSPPSLQTISNRSLAILPEIVPSPMRSMMAPSCSAETGRVGDRLCLPCSGGRTAR